MRRPLPLVLLSSLPLALACGSAEGPPLITPDGGVSQDVGVTPPHDAGQGPVYSRIRIVEFQEFQGKLEPQALAEVGGGIHLATRIRQLREEVPNLLVVTPGDLTGASPLLSRAFHDEPTVAFANLIGLDVMVPGNTDMDRPRAELLRLLNGGCHPEDGCAPGTEWRGADFEVVSANLIDAIPRAPLFDPWTIREVGGVRVGITGTSPTFLRNMIRADHAEGLFTTSSSAAIDRYVPEMLEAGADIIVALVHDNGGHVGGLNECNQPSGNGVGIARQIRPEVQIVFVGQGGSRYVCDLDGRLVMQCGGQGEALAIVDLQFDLTSRSLIDLRARNELVEIAALEPDPDAVALIEQYAALFDVDQEVGRITETISGFDVGAQNAMGFVIADAYLAASATTTDVAFMNTGGVRSSLLWQRSANEPEDGIVRFTELADVMPFGNSVVTITLTGAQIRTLLEDQFLGVSFIPVYASRGFVYRLDFARAGSPVVPDSLTLHGEPMGDETAYRVSVNNFMLGAGRTFEVLREGTDPVPGPLDLDAFIHHLETSGPLSSPPLDRVLTD